MRYKHIIWDWNGTLLDDTRLCVEVLNELLLCRGKSAITEADYRQNFNFPVINFYKYLGFDTSADSFESISHEFIQTYEARWLLECNLHADAKLVLNNLCSHGYSQSILSAAKQEALEFGIRYYGILAHFTELVGCEDIYAHGKITQGQQWLREGKWSPNDIVLIGDTLHDYEVAQSLGTDCILLTHGHHCSSLLSSSKATTVSRLTELQERLY